ncbi:aminoacyl-tRNA hydrolase [Aureococcus anophagefferens]|nr:aminoacyl-tRNA hydrolase [Aureococcus anophagefferens]
MRFASLLLAQQVASFGGARRALARRSMAALSAGDGEASDPLIQYVVLRRDLQESEGWPLGALVAQGAHAAVAAVVESMGADDTRAYVAPEALGSMTKAVLELKGEPQLRALSEKLAADGRAHHLWVEQPENVATCLATAPGRKSALAPHFRKCRLSSWHAPKGEAAA